jgi:hypothetical protein
MIFTEDERDNMVIKGSKYRKGNRTNRSGNIILQHTDSYYVEYEIINIESGFVERKFARYYTNGKDQHSAVRKYHNSIFPGCKIIKLSYE